PESRLTVGGVVPIYVALTHNRPTSGQLPRGTPCLRPCQTVDRTGATRSGPSSAARACPAPTRPRSSRSCGSTSTTCTTSGVGAGTTVFSIVNALLLRPTPGVARPAELALVGRTQAGQGFDTFSYPDFRDYQAGAHTLSGVAAHYEAPVHLSTGGASERLRAA